ncbi:MAG: cytochrome c [Gammaproteobacteria bacterium]|nr:cytochrome c [Gammaproteobacteria bacterium]
MLNIRLTNCLPGVVAAGIVAFSVALPVQAEEDSAIARGGQLYDKWFAVIGADKPKDTHKSWPSSNTKKKGNATWRCKSCHGWDLRGKDGAYASGSYKTGIRGLREFDGGNPADIARAVKDSTHGLGMIPDADIADLALFVTKGQVDMTKYINPDKSVNGDAARGEAYYNTLCAGCHGSKGEKPKDMEGALGKIVSGNPWEGLHKILNGQPDEAMPALRALPLQVAIDTLAYTATLPKKK